MAAPLFMTTRSGSSGGRVSPRADFDRIESRNWRYGRACPADRCQPAPGMQGGQGGGAKIIEVAGTCRGDDLGESSPLQSDRNPLQSIFRDLAVALPPSPMTINDSNIPAVDTGSQARRRHGL